MKKEVKNLKFIVKRRHLNLSLSCQQDRRPSIGDKQSLNSYRSPHPLISFIHFLIHCFPICCLDLVVLHFSCRRERERNNPFSLFESLPNLWNPERVLRSILQNGCCSVMSIHHATPGEWLYRRPHFSETSSFSTYLSSLFEVIWFMGCPLSYSSVRLL